MIYVRVRRVNMPAAGVAGLPPRHMRRTVTLLQTVFWGDGRQGLKAMESRCSRGLATGVENLRIVFV